MYIVFMLEHFFGSRTRVKLLQLFFRDPDKAFYLRELGRLIESQLNAVRREVGNLERLGLLQSVPAAVVESDSPIRERNRYYRLNKEAILYPEIEALLLKAQLLEEEELIEAIKNRGGAVKLLILTGIFTGANDAPAYILLVGSVKPLVLARLIKDYENSTGKSVRYTLFNEREFRERREIGDKFLYSMFETKHLAPVNEYNIT